MINWNFVEKHIHDGLFVCLNEREANEFLTACEEHGIKWACGNKATDWDAWKGMLKRDGNILFAIARLTDKTALRLWVANPAERRLKFYYSDFATDMRAEFWGYLEQIEALYMKMYHIVSKGVCTESACKNCIMSSDEEVCGCNCRMNKLDAII